MKGTRLSFHHRTIKISSLLQEIHSLLGKDSPIRTVEEVEHLIRAEFTQLFDEEKLPNLFDPAILKHMVSVFASKLKEPLRTWSFVTQIGHSSQFELHQTLGESDELSLMIEKSKNRIRPMLQGRIEATNEFLCRNIIEDLVRSIDGLSFALGLAEADPISLVITTVWLSLGGPYDRELPLHPAVGGLCPRVLFRIPGDVDDLEGRQLQQGAIDEVLRHRSEPLVEVMRSNQERARELRNAGALLFDAYAARDDGNGIAMALMALEAMLLEKADSANTVARLSEAVTDRLVQLRICAQSSGTKSRPSTEYVQYISISVHFRNSLTIEEPPWPWPKKSSEKNFRHLCSRPPESALGRTARSTPSLGRVLESPQ